MNTDEGTKRVRSIFVSDIHLGTRDCQSARLLDFLREHEADYLYLVGDIVDFWAMNRGVYWSADQNTVIQKILKRARHGTQVILVPGNHDEILREHIGVSFGEIRICAESIHVGSDGRRYLLVHGDAFDQVTRYHRWIATLGDRGYSVVMCMGRWLSWWRRSLGIAGHWSLSGFVKRRIKTAIHFIAEFEQAAVRHARTGGFDGIICGHIHAAANKEIDNIHYLNCGDWVESCTAVIETLEGQFELIEWPMYPEMFLIR